MHTRTVEAREALRPHEMVVVTGDCARLYTGAGVTVNVELALAAEDVEAGHRGEVHVFITLPQPSPITGEEPTPSADQHYQARVFDAQAGRVWGQLSAAVNRLCKNQRGRQTIACVVDADDIIVRSTTMWKAFGFILDRSRRQLVGWRRNSRIVEALPLTLQATHGQLTVTFDEREMAERDIVTHLERGLWP